MDVMNCYSASRHSSLYKSLNIKAWSKRVLEIVQTFMTLYSFQSRFGRKEYKPKGHFLGARYIAELTLHSLKIKLKTNLPMLDRETFMERIKSGLPLLSVIALVIVCLSNILSKKWRFRLRLAPI